MSWILGMYGEDDYIGDQVETYHPLTPRIIEDAYTNTERDATYVGLLDPRLSEVIDPLPKEDPYKALKGAAILTAVAGGIYYATHRKSPEQKVKDEQLQKEKEAAAAANKTSFRRKLFG